MITLTIYFYGPVISDYNMRQILLFVIHLSPYKFKKRYFIHIFHSHSYILFVDKIFRFKNQDDFIWHFWSQNCLQRFAYNWNIKSEIFTKLIYTFRLYLGLLSKSDKLLETGDVSDGVPCHWDLKRLMKNIMLL